MKKAIFTLALILSIGATQVSLASSAPKHRYHPTTQQVDKQAAAGQASAAQMMRRLLPILIPPQRILPTMLM